VTSSDTWQTDPDFQAIDPASGAPMGLNMETTEQPTLEPRPGPGTVVPKLLTLLGGLWLLWLALATSGRLAKRLNRLRIPRLALLHSALVGLFTR
jgi:hypothetical protein